MGLVVLASVSMLVLVTFALRVATWIALGRMEAYWRAAIISAVGIVVATAVGAGVALVLSLVGISEGPLAQGCAALGPIGVDYLALKGKPVDRFGAGALHVVGILLLGFAVIGLTLALAAMWPPPPLGPHGIRIR